MDNSDIFYTLWLGEVLYKYHFMTHGMYVLDIDRIPQKLYFGF